MNANSARRTRPIEGSQRKTVRRWMFRLWVGLTIVVLAAFLVAATVLEAETTTHRWVAILAAAMAVLMIGAIVWLYIYVRRGPRRE